MAAGRDAGAGLNTWFRNSQWRRQGREERSHKSGREAKSLLVSSGEGNRKNHPFDKSSRYRTSTFEARSSSRRRFKVDVGPELGRLVHHCQRVQSGLLPDSHGPV